MKRYLVCTLLVFSAVSVQAEEADWCKGWTGCKEVTYIIKALGTGCGMVMSGIDYLTSGSVKEEVKKDVVVNDSNLVWIRTKTEEIKARADLAIEDLKKQSNPLIIEQNARHLAALLTACQCGDLERCKEYGVHVDTYQTQLAASKKSATELSQLSIQASDLKKELSTAQDAIFKANQTHDLSKTLVAIEKYNLVTEKIDALVNGKGKTDTVNQEDVTKRSGVSNQSPADENANQKNPTELVKEEKEEKKKEDLPKDSTAQ